MNEIEILILVGLMFVAGHALIMVIYLSDILNQIFKIIEILENKE